MSNTRKTFTRIGTLLLACIACSAVPALADAISGTLTVYNSTGQAVYVTAAPQVATQSTNVNGTHLFYIADANLVNGSMVDKYTMVCSEPGCTASGANISDLLGVFPVTAGGQFNYYLGYMSFGPGGSFSGPSIRSFIDNGALGPIDMTKYLALSKQAAGWTASFVIDPLTPAVPEPGTLAMLGTAVVGGIGVVRSRRTK